MSGNTISLRNPIKVKPQLTAAGYQTMLILGIFIVMSLCMSIFSDKFLTVSNFSNIMTQASLTVIAGSAITLLIISGNLDLSIGGIMAMSGVLYAWLCVQGIPTFVSIILSVLCGSAVGIMNGLFVTVAKLPAFIATMGAMYVARGIAYVLADGNAISLGLPYDFTYIGINSFLGIPLPIIYIIIIFAIFLFVQMKTKFGREIFAVGSNPIASTLSGIKANKITVFLYILSGTLAGFCGVMFTGRLANGDCTIGEGFEFEVIIAAVLGGTDINGGRGSVTGMLIGAMMLVIISNGLNLLGIPSYYQNVIKGIVLIGAIALNKAISNRVELRA
jgi:ribose/xylose/arabinose/galactoside ABC-type transport system permease subunit